MLLLYIKEISTCALHLCRLPNLSLQCAPIYHTFRLVPHVYIRYKVYTYGERLYVHKPFRSCQRVPMYRTLHNFAPTVRLYILYTFRPCIALLYTLQNSCGPIYVQTFCAYITLIYCKILHRPPIYQKNCAAPRAYTPHTIFPTESTYISKSAPTIARRRREFFSSYYKREKF